jgi:translation elongation factor EF-1beta
LNQVAERIKTQVIMEGLVWGEYKLTDIAFGLKKLNFSCVIQDDIVVIDDITDSILNKE